MDLSDLSTPAKRVNITLPRQVLETIDHFAATNGETRSGLLAKAATTYIAAQREKRRRPA